MNLNEDEAVDVIVAVRKYAHQLDKEGDKKTASHYQKLLGTLIKKYEANIKGKG